MAGREVKAGGAFVELGLRSSRFEKHLRSISAKFDRFGDRILSVGTKVTAVGTALAGAFLPAIKAASDMEETMGKFSVVFGGSSDAVKAFSDDLAGRLGRSKQQIASFLASSQDLFVPLGFDERSATAMSKQITQLAVDLASFNNVQDTDALRDLQAALTGSGEVMKKYGVLVSEAAVKQRLLQMSIDPKTATDQQKVLARLNIIIDGTKAAQGDATRTAGSFANQMRALNARFSDMQVAIGQAILPLVTQFVSKAAEIVKRIAGWVEKNQMLVATVFKVGVGVAAVGVGILALGVAAKVAAVGVALLGTAFAVVTSPIGLTVAAIAGAVTAFATLTDAGRATSAFLGETLSKTFQAVLRAFRAGDLEAAGKVALAGLNRIWQTGLIKFQSATMTLAENVRTIFDSMMKGIIAVISQGFIKFGELIEQIFTPAIGKIPGAKNIVGAAFNIQTAARAGGATAEAGIDKRAAQRQVDLAAALKSLEQQLETVDETFKKAVAGPGFFAEGKAGIGAVGSVLGEGLTGALAGIGAGISRAATEGLKAVTSSDAGITNATFSARAAAQLGGFAAKTVEKNTAKTASVLEDIKGLIESGTALLPVS